MFSTQSQSPYPIRERVVRTTAPIFSPHLPRIDDVGERGADEGDGKDGEVHLPRGLWEKFFPKFWKNFVGEFFLCITLYDPVDVMLMSLVNATLDWCPPPVYPPHIYPISKVNCLVLSFRCDIGV